MWPQALRWTTRNNAAAVIRRGSVCVGSGSINRSSVCASINTQLGLRYQSRPRKLPPKPSIVVATSTSRSPQKYKTKRSKPESEAVTQGSSLVEPRGETRNQVIGITTSDSYDTASLLMRLQEHGLLYDGDEAKAVNLMGEAILIPVWAGDDGKMSVTQQNKTETRGEVFIFESGSVVSWGLTQRSLRWFVDTVIQGQNPFEEAVTPIEIGRYAQPDTEMLEYVFGHESTGMHGDTIRLECEAFSSDASRVQDQALLERLAFSAGIARVTKLGVYEAQFEAFAEGASNVPQALEEGSMSVLNNDEVIRRVGTLHNFRQKLNLEDSNLLDEPEFLWHDETLERLYTTVCDALEFDDRMRTLNQQVDYAFALQHDLINLISARRSHRLEVTIVCLVLLEITFLLVKWD